MLESEISHIPSVLNDREQAEEVGEDPILIQWGYTR